MRRIRLWMFFSAIFSCVLTTCVLFAENANDFAKEDPVVVLPSHVVHEGDFFAMGRSIEILGTVRGDVYALGGQIVIDGTVEGDVLAVGGSVAISGHVSKSCRVVGAQVLINGAIGHNVSVLSVNLQLLSTASLGENLVAASSMIDTAAPIGGSATVIAANMRVSSYIHQDLQGYIGKLRITSKAVIDGDVDYRSSTRASIDPGATIVGEVIYRPSLVHKLMNAGWLHQLLIGSQVVVFLMNFIYTLIMGIILVKMFPGNLTAALHALSVSPLRSFLYGILLSLLLPLIFLILLITILGVPFALTLMAFNIIGFYTAKIYSILWVSNWLGAKVRAHHHSLWLYFFTVVIYFGLTMIPVLGWVFALVAMLFGLGAGIAAQSKHGILPKPR